MIIWALVIVVLQWQLAPVLSVRGIEPDFILVFVLYLGLSTEPVLAMLLGFFMGLASDTLAFHPFGLNALILVIVAYVPHLFRARLFMGSVATQLAFLIFFTLMADLIRSTYFASAGQEIVVPFAFRVVGHLAWSLTIYLVFFRWWEKSLPMAKSIP
jgi:rod shape-determining protein MreD